MPKVKPEKIAGIVALSYLVLIPAGAFLAALKIRAMDRDITTIWDHLEISPKEAAELPSLNNLRRVVLGVRDEQ